MPDLITFGPGTTPGQGGTMPAEVRQGYDARLLLTLEPFLIFSKFMDDHDMPQHVGRVMNMRRFERLTPATTPLTEGVTPTNSTLVMSAVQVALQQYGSYILLTDAFNVMAIDNILLKSIDHLAFQASETFDNLARDVMTAGTVAQYANGRVSRATLQAGDNISATEFKKAVRTLAKNFARTIDGFYIAIGTEDVYFDVESISEIIGVWVHQDVEGFRKGSVKEFYGVRFFHSPIGKIYPAAGVNGIDVHATIVFGAEAFVKTSIDGLTVKSIIHNFGSGGSLDPLDQRATVAWKGVFGGCIANQLSVVRIESAVSP